MLYYEDIKVRSKRRWCALSGTVHGVGRTPTVVEEILIDGKMRSKRLTTDLDVKQNIA